MKKSTKHPKASKKEHAEKTTDVVAPVDTPETTKNVVLEPEAVVPATPDATPPAEEEKTEQKEEQKKDVKEKEEKKEKEKEGKEKGSLGILKKTEKKKDETSSLGLTGTLTQKKSKMSRFSDSLNHFGLGKERSRFIENLAILLNSGLSIIDALRTIQTELRVKPMKKLVGKIIDEVDNGIPLWMAMDNQSFFSSYALALIRIGEESGSLSKNMEYLSSQQEKDRALKSKVQMAMIYPSIVLTMTIVITLGLAWFVLPQLVGVLLSLNAELPLVTRIIIWIANYFKANGAVVVPLVFAGLFMAYILCRFTPLRGPAQRCMFMIPGIGSMAKSATIARFGVILGSLLRSGVPLVGSIRSMAEVTDTIFYKKFYFRLADEIEVGQSFGSAFERLKESNKLLPLSVQQLVVTGEKSGRIAEMLMRIADIYEKKAEDAAQRLPVILEPLLLLFMGSLVGTIAFAIIVPIYSIVGSVGR